MIEEKKITKEDIGLYDNNVFGCPVCRKTHDYIPNKRTLCRCGVEFLTIAVGEDVFDMGLMQNLEHEMKLRNKSAVLVNVDYSIAEKYFTVLIMLGEPLEGYIKESIKIGNGAHILIPREDVGAQYIVIKISDQ